MSATTLDEAVELIFDRVRAGLEAADSPLVGDPDVEDVLRSQVSLLVRASFDDLDASAPATVSADRAAVVGTARATQGIHPAESMLAARLLFREALPVLTEVAAAQNAEASSMDVALRLSDEIFGIVGGASVGYVEVLFDRITVVQREERTSIARDIHDRIGHSLASGLMRLEIASTQDDEAEASATRRDATELISQALLEAQSIGTELRQIVGADTLLDAVRLYLSDLRFEGVEYRLEEEGAVRELTASTAEQLFLIMREAMRNSFAHARAHTIGVRLDWGAEQLLVDVWDDGDGFSMLRIRPGAIGLIGMGERAELIGATFSLTSTPGEGTRVRLEVPYAHE